jgi:hypothetical protein
MVTQLYGGADLGAAPRFDGTDAWPVDPRGLNDPSDLTQGSKVQFVNSYLVGNTWVSGDLGTVTVPLLISGFELDLVINHAILSGQLSADHTQLSGGQISGVLDTQQLATAFRRLAGSFDPSLCSGSTIESIIGELEMASDILTDGTQDPTKPCNGISIGLGFNALPAQLGPVAPPPQPPPDPCATM